MSDLEGQEIAVPVQKHFKIWDQEKESMPK